MTVNKNAVPFDDKSPLITSGIRIGTPALTTRGMKEREMEIIGDMIDTVLMHKGDTTIADRVKNDIAALCTHFPLY